ncbi:MAG: VOC family protein [Polyangia bacterium]
MITGAHAIIYSTSPEADRAFLRDVLGLTHVDVGHGWLIFGLPPAELAVHPGERNDHHEQYLMCDDVQTFIAEMAKRNVGCSPVQDLRWGLLTHVPLPGGGKLGVYEPRHDRPGAPPPGATGAPAGYPAVSPYLVVRSAAAVIDFATRAFDAREIRRHTEPDGRIRHAELRIRDAVIMVGERPDADASPVFLHLYVPDVDETYRRALEAGATSVVAPREQDYGDRTAGITDPTGTTWWIGTHQVVSRSTR